MQEKTVNMLEKCIDEIQENITNLTHQKTELEIEISRLKNIKQKLITLLPNNKRLDRLFK